nr:hypothetical transcript [Hymenolepis microstoma]
MAVPTAVPHHLNMEYLSQLFYLSFQLQQSQASRDFHETVSPYMQVMNPATSGLHPASCLMPVNQSAANQQNNVKNTGSEVATQTFALSTESQPVKLQTDKNTNPGNV